MHLEHTFSNMAIYIVLLHIIISDIEGNYIFNSLYLYLWFNMQYTYTSLTTFSSPQNACNKETNKQKNENSRKHKIF